jgi:hypothetical protein
VSLATANKLHNKYNNPTNPHLPIPQTWMKKMICKVFSLIRGPVPRNRRWNHSHYPITQMREQKSTNNKMILF